MNKKQRIRINDSHLKQIVMESVNKILNEAYGTMNAQDSADIARLDNPYPQSKYDIPYNSGKKTSYYIDKLVELMIQMQKYDEWGGEIWNIIYQFGGESYADSINGDFDRIVKKLKRVIALAKMKLGQQPKADFLDNVETGSTDFIRKNSKKHMP